MQRVEIRWVWETMSPLHCGAGLSDPGYADRLIQRDGYRRPIIVGDAVKGALRMSAEQVLAWLGVPQPQYAQSDYTGTAEPQHQLLAALFGGGSHHHYYPARLINRDRDRKHVVASTAIHRETGTAKDETLRYTETLPEGAKFECNCTLWLDGSDDFVDDAIALFLAALGATESVGGKAAIGWGRVKVCEPRIIVYDRNGKGQRVIAEPSDIKTQLNGLSNLKNKNYGSFEGRPRSGGAIPAPAPSTAKKVWWKLAFHLEEPTCVASRPEVANKIAALESIPATVARGALRAAWLRMGKKEEQILTWLGPDTRWTPVYRAVFAAGACDPCVPVPLSFLRHKEDSGLGSEKRGVHDLLVAPLKAAEQWRPVGEGFMSITLNGSAPPRLDLVKPEKEMRMHVARDYVTGSKRAGALFAREALAPVEKKNVFVAYAFVPADIEWPEELFLGKRHSAGNGRVSLMYEKLEGVDRPWPQSWFANAGAPGNPSPPSNPDHEVLNPGTDVLIQLLSPAILRDQYGSFLRTVGIEDWQRILSDASTKPLDDWAAPKGTLCFTASRPVPGWMMPWRHGRAPATVIVAGSVWRLRCKDNATAGMVRSRLGDLAKKGIGERTHEGFGWIAVDPPWLGQEKLCTSGSAKEEKATGERRNWPGCEHASPQKLKEIAREVRAIERLSEAVRGPLQDLATRARDAKDKSGCDRVIEHCEKMADKREKARQWEELRKDQPARRVLEDAAGHGHETLRFVVEALLIRASQAKETSE